MQEKSIAEQIRELDSLRASGSLTDEEFSAAKQKLLSRLGNNSFQNIDLGTSASKAAEKVSSTFSNALSDNESSFRNLAWICYWGTIAVNILGLFPPFFWVSMIVGLGIIIVSALKLSPSSGTIYNSHFKNIVVVAVVSLVGYFLLIVITIGTLGIGLILTIPLGIALVVWYVYRLIKGMLRLNEGQAI